MNYTFIFLSSSFLPFSQHNLQRPFRSISQVSEFHSHSRDQNLVKIKEKHLSGATAH